MSDARQSSTRLTIFKDLSLSESRFKPILLDVNTLSQNTGYFFLKTSKTYKYITHTCINIAQSNQSQPQTPIQKVNQLGYIFFWLGHSLNLCKIRSEPQLRQTNIFKIGTPCGSLSGTHGKGFHQGRFKPGVSKA